jgi:hypothetical protein
MGVELLGKDEISFKLALINVDQKPLVVFSNIYIRLSKKFAVMT